MRFVRGTNTLIWPPDRDAPASPPPAIVFLHGIGERGTGGPELCRTTRWGLPKLRSQGLLRLELPFPFLVAVPQCPPDRTWGDEGVLDGVAALLDMLVKTGEADPGRLIIAGFSMGGYGAYEIALRWPERFAALISVCGKCLQPDRLDALDVLPQWVAWAEDDEIPDLTEGSRAIVERLTAHGRLVAQPYRVGPMDGIGAHPRTADAAFADPRLYTWLRDVLT